jgi:hypothetical protein
MDLFCVVKKLDRPSSVHHECRCNINVIKQKNKVEEKEMVLEIKNEVKEKEMV